MSLESPHNLVHLIVGGAGHMGQNDYAGKYCCMTLSSTHLLMQVLTRPSGCITAMWIDFTRCGSTATRSTLSALDTRTAMASSSILVRKMLFSPSLPLTTRTAQPGGGTYYQLDTSRLDQATDMLPFRKSLNSYWTPLDTASLELKNGVWPKCMPS